MTVSPQPGFSGYPRHSEARDIPSAVSESMSIQIVTDKDCKPCCTEKRKNESFKTVHTLCKERL